jgi:hypothetical protein
MAVCAYISFFTGVPVAAFRLMRPSRSASFALRIAIVALIPFVTVLPDVVLYMLLPSSTFDASYSARHLLDPFRTLANWNVVEERFGFAIPIVIGLTGLLAYATLIGLGTRMTVQSVSIEPHGSTAAAGAPRSADSLY